MTPIDTYGRRLSASIASRKLTGMLQNTLRSFPTMKVQTRRGGFGVFTDDGTYLYVSFSGSLNADQKRDLLALFATWLVVDPEGLDPQTSRQNGLYWREAEE